MRRRTFLRNVAAGGLDESKADWLQFFKDFTDHLLIACDQFVGIPGRTKRPPMYIEETWTAANQLPADVLNKAGRENAVKLELLH